MPTLVRRHLLVIVLAVWAASEPWTLHGLDPWREAIAGVLVTLPLLLRHRLPVVAASVTLAAVLAQLAFDAAAPRSVAAPLCIVVAGYLLGASAPRLGRWPVAGGAVALAFLAAAHVLSALDVGIFEFTTTQTHVFLTGLVVGGLMLGFALRDRTARAAALRRDVDVLEQRVSERLAEAASAERAWIARHLEVLVAQVAEHVPALEAAGADRRAASAALGDAERLARDAIGRLGRLLGLLREIEVPAAAPVAGSAPRFDRERLRRLRTDLAPWLLVALFGTVEQLLLPDRPIALMPGVVVEPPQYPTGVVLVLCWLTPLPLVWRRRAPLAVIAAIGAMLVLRTAADDLSSLTWTQHFLGIGLAFLAGAYARTTVAALVGLALAAATTVTCWAFEELPMAATEYAYLAALLIGSWVIGRGVGDQLRAAERTRVELAGLEARRAELEGEVVRLERRRVAREVHDLVGHGLSLVSVHAAASARRVELGEASVGDALDEVRELAAVTQRELVALLELLRTPGLREQPRDADLSAVDELVDQARRHGHTVELDVTPGAVTPAIAEAVTDIVREGLTNVRKHAGPVPTDVGVCVGEGTVEVVVANAPGSPTLGRGTGSGLHGLADRVRELGGELDAGATPTGGWRVRGVLPAIEIDRSSDRNASIG